MLESNFRLVFHSKSPNSRQTPHFSVEYKSEGFGDAQYSSTILYNKSANCLNSRDVIAFPE